MKRIHDPDDAPESDFVRACRQGDQKQVERGIHEGHADLIPGLKAACGGGHVNIVGILTDHLQTAWFPYTLDCLAAALQADHGALALVLLQKSTTPLSTGLYMACCVGRIDMMEFMMKQLESSGESYLKLHWNMGLALACRGCHRHVMNRMIEKGATDWNLGFRYACIGGDMQFIKDMVDRGATEFKQGLEKGCELGNMELIRFMIEKGADNWDGGLIKAVSTNHVEAVKLMIEKGATVFPRDLFLACTLETKWILWQNEFVDQLQTFNSTEVDQLIQWGMPPSGFSDPVAAAHARLVWLRTLAVDLSSSLPMPIIEWVILPYL